ncbi:hypothetical protein [Mycoplasma mycoides]|uniref:hypothetical protein n=1 Tax=Mycoplasma mycoides TaxID=2102 RepID=UPI00273275C3|nr:hypothetical protein [Mycoplasma mycoides]MDP4040162.1 hypothetical protein [Mycoplasma mycoides]MDP4041029.1 hypothetical protein [Mycoplasma mycoides]MDP4042026.1 hypothetical protein [Mycoplasma mycoides]MDP4043903.1 hypothetical protein [Mycoplasma mycoides]MDP4044801.1 hypothetical protein [Mycoplasma mycoides]
MKKILPTFSFISLTILTSITTIGCKNIDQKQSYTKEIKNQNQSNSFEKKDNQKIDKTNEANFYLIKKYGLEINNLLKSSKNKVEELVKKPELGKVFKLISNLIQLYQDLNKFDALDKFTNTLKSQLENKQPKISYDEFLNKIFMQWQETITEYEKERNTILKLLK